MSVKAKKRINGIRKSVNLKTKWGWDCFISQKGKCGICHSNLLPPRFDSSEIGIRREERQVKEYIIDSMLLNIDHIIPINLGGRNTRDNVQIVHMKCNNWKGGIYLTRWSCITDIIMGSDYPLKSPPESLSYQYFTKVNRIGVSITPFAIRNSHFSDPNYLEYSIKHYRHNGLYKCSIILPTSYLVRRLSAIFKSYELHTVCFPTKEGNNDPWEPWCATWGNHLNENGNYEVVKMWNWKDDLWKQPWWSLL